MVGDDSLVATEQTFRWDKVDGDLMMEATSDTITFDPLSLEDEGQYTCTSVTTSPYLTSMPMLSNTETVFVYGRL